MAASILGLVADDANERRLKSNLVNDGYRLVIAKSIATALAVLNTQPIDLLVLGVGASDPSVSTFLVDLRNSVRLWRLPVVSMDSEPCDRDGTDVSNDLMDKSNSIATLRAQVHHALGAVNPAFVSSILQIHDTRMDRLSRDVFRGDRKIQLGPTEYRLLEVMIERQGRALPRSHLALHLGGLASNIRSRSVDVYVGRLRRSLVQDGDPDPIRSVRGVGYIIE